MLEYQFCQRVWFNGKLLDLNQPLFDLRSTPIHYGIGVMDSIRGYPGREGLQLFRVRDHLQRLYLSARMYHLNIPFEVITLEEAVLELIRANSIQSDCYVQIQVNPGNLPRIGSVHAIEAKVDVSMLATLNPTLLGSERFFANRKAIISSWRAIPHDVLPVAAKANGNFANYFLAGVEAKKLGADAAIILDHDGFVCEASSANVFIVRKDGCLLTPPSNAPILSGITRETLIQLLSDLNLRVEETRFPRSELCKAAEAFICGTGAEIQPITQIEDLVLSEGAGPITRQIADYYLRVVTGQVPKYKEWLTRVA